MTVTDPHTGTTTMASPYTTHSMQKVRVNSGVICFGAAAAVEVVMS